MTTGQPAHDPFFHVGILVRDIEQATGDFGRLLGIRFEPVQQAGESVVSRGLLLVALYFRRLGRAHGARRGDHEVDVVVIGALGRIHALFLLHFLRLRNF